MWWFDDGARIPAKTLKEYGRQVLQQNRLKDKGGVVIDGVELDLGAITTPVMIVALKDDHVSAWKNTYAGRSYFGGPTRFLLGGSGHNAGMINPPAANKHGYWTNDEAPADADATIAIAQPWDQVTTGTAKDPEDFGQCPTIPTAGGDDNSSIASDSSHAQQEKGSVTTPVHGQPASPTGTGGLAV